MSCGDSLLLNDFRFQCSAYGLWYSMARWPNFEWTMFLCFIIQNNWSRSSINIMIQLSEIEKQTEIIDWSYMNDMISFYEMSFLPFPSIKTTFIHDMNISNSLVVRNSYINIRIVSWASVELVPNALYSCWRMNISYTR